MQYVFKVVVILRFNIVFECLFTYVNNQWLESKGSQTLYVFWIDADIPLPVNNITVGLYLK